VSPSCLIFPQEWGTKGVDKPLMRRCRAWIPASAGMTRYRACRGAQPLCFSLVSPMNGGRRGLTQDHAETVQQDAAGGLRVSHPHLALSLDGRWFRLVQGVKRGRAPLLLLLSPKIEDPPQEEWGIKGVDRTLSCSFHQRARERTVPWCVAAAGWPRWPPRQGAC